MKIKKLENQIREKKSFLCIGLDIDLDRIPSHLKGEQDPIFSFAKELSLIHISEPTRPY